MSLFLCGICWDGHDAHRIFLFSPPHKYKLPQSFFLSPIPASLLSYGNDRNGRYNPSDFLGSASHQYLPSDVTRVDGFKYISCQLSFQWSCPCRQPPSSLSSENNIENNKKHVIFTPPPVFPVEVGI